jgi:hypothetical protein
MLLVEGVNVVKFGIKIKVLKVTMDYEMLVQARYLPTKNESCLRKSNSFYKFYKEMKHNIDECEEFY